MRYVKGFLGFLLIAAALFYTLNQAMESRLRVSRHAPEQGRAVVTWTQLRANLRTMVGRPGLEETTDEGLINLNQLEEPGPLVDMIRLYTTPEENDFVAEKLFEYIRQATVNPENGARRPLGRTGALLGAKIDPAEVAGNTRLPSLAKRVAESASETEPLLTRSDLNALRRFLVVHTAAEVRRQTLTTFFLFLLSFALVGLLGIKRRLTGDWMILLLVMLLSGLASILLFTLRDPLRDRSLYPDVVGGILLGNLAFAVTLLWMDLRKLEGLKYIYIIGAMLLSGLLIVFGTGPAGTSAKLTLFGFFQPVEIIKLLVVAFLAGYFADKGTQLRYFSSVETRLFSLPRKQDYAPLLLMLGFSLLLFYFQQDLGPALVLYITFLFMFTIATGRLSCGLLGLAMLIGSFWACYHYRYPHTVVTRIEMWLSPWNNSHPGGSQVAEALWALASGGLSGQGWGQGSPGYIPAGHTDLIYAAAGEELGLIGLVALLAIILFLFQRGLRAALSADNRFGLYLASGFAFLFAIQTLTIVGGTIGLTPLTGITLPFLSYGKSATVACFILFAVILSISAHAKPMESKTLVPIYRSMRRGGIAVAGLFAVVTAYSFYVMVLRGDHIASAVALSPQGDQVRRYSYNNRLLEIAQTLPRGTIYDRNGLPLATNDWKEVEAHTGDYETLGLNTAQFLTKRQNRYYPLGPYAVHMVGHKSRYWTGATIEREYNRRLMAFDDYAKAETIDNNVVIRRDYRELVPLLRTHSAAAWAQVRDKKKDVRTTLDVRLQKIAYDALTENFPVYDDKPRDRGAVVILDAQTGELLASVSLPSYNPNALDQDTAEAIYHRDTRAANDRARFEIYPPGSTFKLITAAAALEAFGPRTLSREFEFFCAHTNYIPWHIGRARHVRRIVDDEMESAHGRIGLPRALVLSCNGYFAWLGTRLGAEALFEMAKERLNLELKGIQEASQLRDNLPDNAYGQAKITVSPLSMARVAAIIANNGVSVPVAWVADPRTGPPEPVRVLKSETAAALKQSMVGVVEWGTGRRTRITGLTVGGKTGTAQNETGDGRSHAWFVGFAPAQAPEGARQIAFAILIENGGYGGRAAASTARTLLERAVEAEILQPNP